MLETNIRRVVMQSLQGKIQHPLVVSPYRIRDDGEARVLPATGGITYNVKIGDPAFGWEGDHVEPGVTIKNENIRENAALNTLACIGNEAIVLSGDAKGAKGYVTGKHGGVEHVLLNFKEEDLFKLSIDDKILIKGYGQGFRLINFPNIVVMNIDPRLFLKLNITSTKDVLNVPIKAIVPPQLMGSGIGSITSCRGDFDIMTSDKKLLKKYKLDELCFGDLVLIEDFDVSYGRGYLQGAVTIGIVIHSDCIKSGHGPGITTIMSCKSNQIKYSIDKDANIENYIKKSSYLESL